MKKLTITPLTILSYLASTVVWGADYQKGSDAAQRGDFVRNMLAL